VGEEGFPVLLVDGDDDVASVDWPLAILIQVAL
jgi:hypothetical protein